MNGRSLRQLRNCVWIGFFVIGTLSVSAQLPTATILGVDGIREYRVETNSFSAE